MQKGLDKKLYKLGFRLFAGTGMLVSLWAFLKTGDESLMVICAAVWLALWVLGEKLLAVLRKRKLLESGIEVVEQMEEGVLEEFILELLKSLGYKGRLIPKKEDLGADMILEKDGKKIVVQAKKWKKSVGVGAVQQAAAAVRHYGTDAGIVISATTFTENAHELANSNRIELWDREKLTELMDRHKAGKLAKDVAEKAAAGEEQSPDLTDNR